MLNVQMKTLVEEVFDTRIGSEKDIVSQLCPYRVLAWFTPQGSDSTFLLRLVSMLAKRMDWEMFEPGSAPIITVHYGSIYSFKNFAQHQSGVDEADALVLGTSTGLALEKIISIIETMALEQFIKFDQDSESIAKALHILHLYGVLTFDTWIEPTPANSEYEQIERRHELNYGLEIKRPRDSVEGDLFAEALDESAALKLLLKIVARKTRRRVRQVDGVMKAWELLRQARELLNYGCVNEAGVVAGTALEELLVTLTHVPYGAVKRDKLVIGKIISIVEKNKKLTSLQTRILREFGEVKTECARALAGCPNHNNDLSAEVSRFIDWLDDYPDWLR